MIVKLYKEEDVEVDLENLIKYLNEFSKNITFQLGIESFKIKDENVILSNADKYLTSKIKKETEYDLFDLFITNKQYPDNYFFHEIDNKKNILSLYGWHDLTSYSKNTGVFYFILWILALYIDSEERHIDDIYFDCIYNFARDKTEIDAMIHNACICDTCQERLESIGDDNKLIFELLNLLDELNKLSRNDIIEYWNSLKKEKVKIFFSYAHKDREFLNEFKEYIKVFERNGLVERWDDNELIVGEKWNESIKDKIYSADIIIFLISSTSLASDYIYKHELKIAFELNDMSETYVAPIIIKDCLWDMTDFKDFQILPLDGRAVNSWNKREEAWTSVARGLKKAIDNIIEAKQRSQEILRENIKDDTETKLGSVLESLGEDSDKKLILKFLKTYSRWWFNISRIISWGSEREGFRNIRNISFERVKEILDEELSKNEKSLIKAKSSTKNKNSILYKMKG